MKLFTRFKKINLDRLAAKLGRMVRKAHMRYMNTEVIRQASLYAEKGLPGNDDEYIEPFIQAFRGFYNRLKKDVSVRLNGRLQKMLSTFDTATINLQIERLKGVRDVLNEKIRQLHIDKGRIFIEQDFGAYNKNQVFLFMLAAGEALWTIGALLYFGDMMIVAAITGLLIGFAQIIGVKYAVLVIREIEDEDKRKIWTGVATAFFVLLSVVFGIVRYKFINSGTGVVLSLGILNPLPFTLISILFSVGAGLLVLFLYPSLEDIRKMGEITRINKNIHKANIEIAPVAEKIASLENDRNIAIELRGKIENVEKILNEQIDACFDESVGVFKTENMSRRIGKIFPIAFSNPHRPLSNDNLDDYLYITT